MENNNKRTPVSSGDNNYSFWIPCKEVKGKRNFCDKEMEINNEY